MNPRRRRSGTPLRPVRLYGDGGLRLWYGRGGLPAAAATGGLHGFPAVLTSFIGQEEAVRDVAGLLGEGPLVTVTRPGGVGKTRLAGQVARLVAGRFADGAWLAELAAVRDPARLASYRSGRTSVATWRGQAAPGPRTVIDVRGVAG